MSVQCFEQMWKEGRNEGKKVWVNLGARPPFYAYSPPPLTFVFCPVLASLWAQFPQTFE